MENQLTIEAVARDLRISPIKVAIIEDERDIRECLTFLINGTAGVHTRSEAVAKALVNRLV